MNLDFSIAVDSKYHLKIWILALTPLSLLSAIRILIFSKRVETTSTNDLHCRINQSDFAKVWERYRGTARNSVTVTTSRPKT